MESWRITWRRGFLPQAKTEALESLLTALELNDPRLIRCATTSPPTLWANQDETVEATCGVGWLIWKDGETTVGELEEAFAKICYEADLLSGEPAACRWFLNWFDQTPRDEMRRSMIEELRINIQERKDDYS